MIKVKLHRVMANRDIKSQKLLCELTGIAPQSMTKIFGENIKAIRLNTLNRLCRALDCQVGDILEYVPDE